MPTFTGPWGHYGRILLIAGGIGLAFVLGWLMAPDGGPADDATAEDAATDDAGSGAEVWTCSMHPSVQRPGPGLCPICAMELIPRSGADDGGAGPREFVTTEAAAALMRIETAPAERRFAEAEVRLVGEVRYDETRLAYITAWAPGRIERMYADFTGTRVREGDHLVDLYSPELLAAKAELHRARQALDTVPANAPEVLRDTARGAIDAARSRLRRWGLTAAQIDAAEADGPTSDRITIYAPIGGTVIERNGQEGMYVDTGEPLYTIADLERVWVQLRAYESDLPWIHFGQTVEFTSEAYPGERFEGQIAFIDPELNERTRTVDIRVNVPNRDGLLKPGMFVRAVVRSRVATGGRVLDASLAGKWISPMHPEIVKDGPGACDICGMALVPTEEMGYVSAGATDAAAPLVIPATAPLITGKRAVVYVEQPDADRPTYEGREIVLGPRAGDYYLVESGLAEGERVVTHGNFKIDSAMEIAAKPSMMSMDGGPIAGAGAADPALQTALRALFEAYIPLQEALAHDDAEAARAALPPLQEAAEALPDEEAAAFVPAVGALAAAETLEEWRTAFQPLSDALASAIEAAGIAEGSAVHRVHCPMAFGAGEGADWLQRDAAVRNPYLGERMFSCGTVEAQIAADTEAAHAGHDHGGAGEGGGHE